MVSLPTVGGDSLRVMSQARVHSRLLVLGVAALVGASACSSSISGVAVPAAAGADPSPSLTPGGTATGTVPAGLASFYGQKLSWTGCADYASTDRERASYANDKLDCTRVTVPLDYTKPTGPTASIALLRLRATGERIGSMLVNPGGPGASGASLAASLSTTLAGTPLAKRLDLVGFDPRGVGASKPAVACLTDAEADAERKDLDVDTSAAGIAQTEKEEKDFAGKCAARVGDDVLEHVGTREVVQDMDVIRSVLGDAKLTYVGFSYGTRIGATYAEKFPANVRAMVLDGALDPEAGPVQELIGQATGFQGAFTAYAKDCATRPGCPLGTDPTKFNTRFRALTVPLIAKPVSTDDPRGLGYNDAVTGTLQALYSPQLWPALTTGLTELTQGRGNTLLRLADVYSGRAPDGHYSHDDDAFNAIRCVDDPPVTDRAVTDAADAAYRKAAPFLDDGIGSGRAPLNTCAFWPVPHTGTPHEPKVTGLAPTVVISTTGDPATPYQAGVQLARQLGGALITYRGTQHTVAFDGVSCVDDAVSTYLSDLRTPPPGLTC